MVLIPANEETVLRIKTNPRNLFDAHTRRPIEAFDLSPVKRELDILTAVCEPTVQIVPSPAIVTS